MILKLKDGEVKIELFPDVAPGHVNRIKEYDWINPTLKRNQQTSAQRKQAYDNAIGLEFDEADSDGFETFAKNWRGRM